MTDKEALKRVQLKLHAIQQCHPHAVLTLALEAEEIIEEALAKQEQGEPVAKVCHDLDGHIGWNPSLTELPDEGTELYTTPQQRKPMTVEQLEEIWKSMWGEQYSTKGRREQFARAIEATHGIKGEL